MIEFAPAAFEELEHAIWRYEDEQFGLGESFNSAVEASIDAIAESPQRFARYEGCPTRHECRRKLVSGFPYLIVYQVIGDTVRIVAVAHASRRPGYWEAEE